MRRIFAIFLWFSACAEHAPVGPESPVETWRPQLRARGVLPANSFGPGPPSGSRLPADAKGPFSSQPIQGFSGLWAQADGGFLAVADNGYGAPETSADFLLRVYAVAADFEGGALRAEVAFTLRDPDRQVPWPIVNAFTEARLLTGADLDPESLVRAPDGTYWFGDEHGPFLVHTDDTGRLLEPPYPLALDGGTYRSPDNPHLRANLMLRSLEALAAQAAAFDASVPIVSPDERWLTTAQQVSQLEQAGFRVVPWTVNEPKRMAELVAWGVDGVITDRPDLGAVVLDAGRDLQGHRGARGLAPEETRAAFEAGLDAGITTLELDLTATADDTPIVWHDERVGPPKCRGVPDAGLSAPRTKLEVLRRARCDGLLPTFPRQTRWRHRAPFTLLTLPEVLAYGRPLNVETKVHGTGAPHDDPEVLTRYIARTVEAADAGARVTLQSFDWRSLLLAHQAFPWLRTVALFGRPTLTAEPASRAGLPWPEEEVDGPVTPRSGGFENLALTSDGRTLVAMLEKPVGERRECLAFAFDLETKRFTHLAFVYPLDSRGTAVGDLTMIDATHGYALERDDSQGQQDGFKRLMRFTLPSLPGGVVTKSVAADLLDLAAPDGGVFSFPFWTIEGVAVLPNGRVAIVNDNNFPFGRGRSTESPDATELIVVEPQ